MKVQLTLGALFSVSGSLFEKLEELFPWFLIETEYGVVLCTFVWMDKGYYNLKVGREWSDF